MVTLQQAQGKNGMPYSDCYRNFGWYAK